MYNLFFFFSKASEDDLASLELGLSSQVCWQHQSNDGKKKSFFKKLLFGIQPNNSNVSYYNKASQNESPIT